MLRYFSSSLIGTDFLHTEGVQAESGYVVEGSQCTQRIDYLVGLGMLGLMVNYHLGHLKSVSECRFKSRLPHFGPADVSG